jgi:hypothetical protein
MKLFPSAAIPLLLISLFAAAQEQPERVKHVAFCFGPMPAADRKLKPVNESGVPKADLPDEHSVVLIRQANLDISKIVLPPALGAHRTALVSEQIISPYRPLRWLMYCQVADLYADGGIAIH